MPSMATRARASPPIRRFRKTNRAIRSITNSRWEFPPASASSATCIRDERAQHVPRLHVVGRRNRRRADVPGRADGIRPKNKWFNRRCRTPTKRRPKGCGRIRTFWRISSNLNSSTKHTQFADFHGHGWVFRAVFKKDRSGNYLDYLGRMIPDPSNVLFQAADGAANAGRTCSRQTARRRAGPLDGYSSGKGHALHRLPFQPGQSRQHEALW